MDFKKLLVIGLVLFLSSCKVLKKTNKRKEDSTATEQIIQKTFRKGDTVTYKVPNVILKDTTIYTYNRVGSTVVTRFDKEGKVDSVACIASALEEFSKINRELVRAISEKDREVERDSTGWIWAAFGAFALVFLVCFSYLVLQLKKVSKFNS